MRVLTSIINILKYIENKINLHRATNPKTKAGLQPHLLLVST